MTNKTKIDDLAPFEHGQEDTHMACVEMVKKYGASVKCCTCTGHKCVFKPQETSRWEDIFRNKFKGINPIHAREAIILYVHELVSQERLKEREKVFEEIIAQIPSRGWGFITFGELRKFICKLKGSPSEVGSEERE